MHIDWEPEIDTPATIAVIGAGPVGVEAALYARFLGYDLLLFDSRRVGHRQLAWGDHPLEPTWAGLTSPLGLAALAAQGADPDLLSRMSIAACSDPCGDVSYRQYVEQYLIPVARTDLLYDSVQVNSPIISISRTSCGSDPTITNERRAEQEFRLLIDSRQRGEYTQLVDIVLDCSGLARPLGLASGGGWAIGERTAQPEMLSGRVDVLGKHRARLAGKHTLLFGRDDDACGNAIDLAELTQAAAGTRATWILPKQFGNHNTLSLQPHTSAEFIAAARRLADNEDSNSPVVSLAAWGIESMQVDGESGWRVRLQVSEEETLNIQTDELINCQAVQPDWSFAQALPLAQHQAEDGLTGEPHYYVLGQKAVGASNRCTMPQAFEQIKKVFARIGGRAELDLYETVRRHHSA
ncbi:MAG: hypothetical protein KDA72_04600 [Planctomycetales bacterium]|nr:hypothetical protein [Planctomycetales bacterium]